METVEALAARLSANPADREAYQALKALYRTQEDYGSLANLVAGWAAWVTDDRAAASAYVEVGDILAQHLAEHSQAEAFYLEALKRDPLSSAGDALQALWESQGAYVRVADFLQEQLSSLAALGAPARQLAALSYKLGVLWSQRMHAPSEALLHFRKALELDPNQLAAVREARRLLIHEGDSRGAAELYEREAALEPDPERKLALFAAVAALYRDTIGDADGAIAALQRAHGLAPADIGVSYDLAALLLGRAEHADERSARSDRAQVAELMCGIAAAVEVDQAVDYLEKALDCVPQHEQALAELERLLEGSEQGGRLPARWVGYLANAPDGAQAGLRRVKLARAYAAQGQIDDAIFCLTPAAQRGLPAAVKLLEQLRANAAGDAGGRAEPGTDNGSEAARPARPGRALRRRSLSASSLRVTTDMDDIKTVVGERDLIESLREATAEVALEPRAELRSAPPAYAAWPSSEVLQEPPPVPPIEADAEPADLDELEEIESEPPAAPAPPPPVAQRQREEFDAEQMQGLRRDAAALAREQREGEAAALYQEILAAEPRDREAFAFLDGYYRRKQQHALRAQLLEHSAGVEGLPDRVRITRLREAASTYEARLKDYGAAIRTLHSLTQLEQSDDVERTLKRLLERAERWDDLAQLYEAEIARSEQAATKLPTLKRLAALHRDKRGDRASAADVLERMLILKPEDRAIRDTLIEDLLAIERYEDVVPLLERKIEDAATRPQKLALLTQLAALCRDRLGDPERAFGVHEQALALAPGDRDTIAQLLRLGERLSSQERLLATLDRQVGQMAPMEGAALLAQLAQICDERLRDHDRSSELLARAVDLAPDQPQYLQALCEAYERDQRYEDLVELLRERTVLERNPQARVELYRRIARVLDLRLSDAEGAQEAWEKLLQIKEDSEALRALRQRASERDDPEALAKLLGRMAGLEPELVAQRDLLFERACLLTRRLQRPADALPDLARILRELDPSFEPAFDELGRAADAAGEYRSLAQVLEQRLESERVREQQIEYAKRLADLYERRLADPERAIYALQRWADGERDDPEPQRRLSPLLARARRYEQLLVTLDALTLLETTPTARERAAIQAAEVAQQRLEDTDGAWQRLLPFVEQGSEAALQAALPLAQATRRLGELYDVLERSSQSDRLLGLLRDRSGREQETHVRVTLLRRIAQLLIEHRQDEAGAAEAYRKLLELEEDVDALRFLQALALREDDPKTLADVLKRLAALEEQPEERRELLFEHARLLTARLERPAEAVLVLRALLGEDPEYEPALEELIVAAEAAHDHATLADCLERMLARTSEVAARVELAMRLADTCERQLRDPARAVAALRLWAVADPEDPEPHRRLRPQLQNAGQERELLLTLDALARSEPEYDARIEATLAAATLARNQLDDAEGAWQRLTPLLPDAEPRVDRALYGLASETGRQDELYKLLEQAGRHRTLVEWLGQRIVVERDDAIKVALYRHMAHTLVGPLDDEAGAEDAWSRRLRLQEDTEALGFMRSLALRRDDMEALGDCLRRLAALEPDRNERRDLLYEYGHLLHARLRRPAEAVVVLRQVVEQLDGDFEPALDELIQASEAAGDDPTLADALQYVLGREADPELRAELAQRLASLCVRRMNDRERAIAALGIWAQAAPRDPEPHAELVSLLTGSERHAELLAALDALAQLAGDDKQRAEAQLRAAELAYDRLGDAEGAFARLLPVANGHDPRAEALLARVAFESGKTDALFAFYEGERRYDDLIEVLRTQAERSADAKSKAELYRRCARLLQGPLADNVAAAEAFREVLSFGEDVEALSFLRQQAIELDDPATLAEMLERLAALTEAPHARRDLVFERALLLADRLEQPEAAAALLRSLLNEIDPNFRPAIEELTALSEASSDYASLAFGLERLLALEANQPARAAIAERLASLYEDKLQQHERATAALLAWHAAAPNDPAPLRRLRPQFERSRQWRESIGVLDALSICELSVEARHEAALAAAELAFSQLGDAEGAWTRLSAAFLAGDERAEHAAQQLAARSSQYRPLVNLHVLRAQQHHSPEATLRDWMQAVELYEQKLNEPAEAFEAGLRALAVDMQNRALLDAIDRLAIATGAWERLGRVYGRLVQEAHDAATKVELLARNAALGEQHGQDPNATLERMLEACRLAPARDDLLERALGIATRLGAHAELVWLYEHLAHNATGDEARARQLLRAARVADLGLKDREQALRNMSRALALTQNLPNIAGELEELASELDLTRPELGKDDARRALVQAHIELAQSLGEPFGPLLIQRAARLLREELGDASSAFDALKQGATLFPDDLDLYDALEHAALAIKRFDALDAHLARAAQRASDFGVKRALLLRRAKLLADHLQRHAKAAEVYRELLAVDPDNGPASDALLRSLRQAGNYQELLKAYTDRLAQTDAVEVRLRLMREMALLWEIELKNRPSALELWRVVRALAPEDQEAVAALSRLDAR